VRERLDLLERRAESVPFDLDVGTHDGFPVGISVVVNDFDVLGPGGRPSEADAPLPVDAVSLELLKSVPRLQRSMHLPASLTFVR